MLTRVHFDMHQRPMGARAMELDRKSTSGMGCEPHAPLASRLDYCFDVISVQVDGDQAVTRPEQFHPVAPDSAHGARPVCQTAILEGDLKTFDFTGLLRPDRANRHSRKKHYPDENRAR
jgi:hypothetical protein